MPEHVYVNLRDPPPGEPELRVGRTHTLTARVESTTGSIAASGMSMAAEWQITDIGSDNLGTSAQFGGGTTRTDTDFRAGVNGFTTEVTFPLTGGNRYRVTCDKPGVGEPDLRMEFETWRRLYYYVDHHSSEAYNLFRNAIEDVKREFRRVFISLRSAGHRGGSPERLTREEMESHCRQHAEFDSGYRPYVVRFLLARELADPGEEDIETDNSVEGGDPGEQTDFIEVLPRRVDQIDSIDSLEISRDRARWIDVRDLADHDEEAGMIFINYNEPAYRARTGWPVLPSSVLVSARGHIRGGHAFIGGYIPHTNVIGLTINSNWSNEIISSTIVHELAHWLGQVEDNRRNEYYERNGPHCHHNCRLEADREGRSDRTWETVDGQACCVMFHAVTDRADGFCPNCVATLRERDLDIPDMQRLVRREF